MCIFALTAADYVAYYCDISMLCFTLLTCFAFNECKLIAFFVGRYRLIGSSVEFMSEHCFLKLEIKQECYQVSVFHPSRMVLRLLIKYSGTINKAVVNADL